MSLSNRTEMVVFFGDGFFPFVKCMEGTRTIIGEEAVKMKQGVFGIIWESRINILFYFLKKKDLVKMNKKFPLAKIK